MTAQQKAFERWYLGESPLNTVDKTPSGLASDEIYCKPATRRAWAAWKAGSATVLSRIQKAIDELQDMIDGGEECRGRDSEISRIIRLLEGESL